MEILKSKVDLFINFDNTPVLQVLVNKIPSNHELSYNVLNNIYLAERDGYIDFYFYSGPSNGFGGQHFNIKMKDGTEKVLIGPWKVSAKEAFKAGFPLPPEINIIDSEKGFDKGYTFSIANLSYYMFLQEANKNNCNVGFLNDEPIVMPRCCGKPTQKYITNTGREYLCDVCAAKLTNIRKSYETDYRLRVVNRRKFADRTIGIMLSNGKTHTGNPSYISGLLEDYGVI